MYIDAKFETILCRLHCLSTFFNKGGKIETHAHSSARITRHKIVEKGTNEETSILSHPDEVGAVQKQTKKKINFR